MKKIFLSENCPVCEIGRWEPKSDEVYAFRYGRKEHRLTGLHYALCNKCGTRGYLPGQRQENQKLVHQYQAKLVGYISPSDVLALREKYLLTQKQAQKIFGGGSQSFSKWERGITSPAGPTARLIKLALRYPEVMRDLARDAGVRIAESIASEKPSHVFVYNVKTIGGATSHIEDDIFQSSDIDVEQDEYPWSQKAKKHHRKEFAYLN